LQGDVSFQLVIAAESPVEADEQPFSDIPD
jgi:hypothetical protein